jgi:hypothetical protein
MEISYIKIEEDLSALVTINFIRELSKVLKE